MSDELTNILLIEDNPADARLLREYLLHEGDGGFSLVSADSLHRGIERVHAGRFDAILLDLTLPDSSGLDTVTRFRADAPTVPLVVLTGVDDEETGVQALREGAQDYLVKGQTDRRLLVRAIRYAVERKRLEEALRDINANLERQVEQRTRELKTTNVRLVAEIQERQKAEDERRRVEAIARSRERLAMLGGLAAEVVHQFRNPMQGVMSYIDLIKLKAAEDSKIRPLLDRVEDGLREMDRVAASLLDLSRVESKPTESCRIETIVEKAFDLIRPRAQKRRVTLVRDVDAGVPPVFVNPIRIVEALLNLIGNSLDACQSGGTVRVTAHHLPLQPSMVEVRVSDNGCGIPEELRERVFEPFFTTKPIGEGTGLGLSIVRRIVEIHGGCVEVVNGECPGTTISFWLPVATGEEGAEMSPLAR